MDHLSGLDASFLYLETPETPMHVGGLNIVELPAGYEGDFLDDFRNHIASRMHLAPVFQRKLVNMPFEMANPVWVADDDVDLEYHVRSAALPKPGNRAQLDKLVGRLHSGLLDRSRPLWEFYVIEGVQSPPDAPSGTRHVAFYSKVHHCALDGAGGIVLANAIMDTGPVPRHVRGAPAQRSTPPDNYGVAELALSSLRQTRHQAGKLLKSLPALAGTLVGVWRASRRARAAGGEDSVAKNNWFAPRTPINVSVTNQRLFSSFSVPLAEVKHIAKGNDASLNDVVLAICSGALRYYLADRGCVPEAPLLAGVPVSLREAGNTDLNNQVSMMRVSLASTIADPLERLQAIRNASTLAKATSASMKAVSPTDFPSLGAPWLISGLASLLGRSRLANNMPPLVNVAISNVPGPKMALYLAGAKLLTYYPVSIAVHSVALNVTVQSYNGLLDFGLTACRKALPDLPELAKLMQAAHQELLQLTPVLAAEKAADKALHQAMDTHHKPAKPVAVPQPDPVPVAKSARGRKAAATAAKAVKKPSASTASAKSAPPIKLAAALANRARAKRAPKTAAAG